MRELQPIYPILLILVMLSMSCHLWALGYLFWQSLWILLPFPLVISPGCCSNWHPLFLLVIYFWKSLWVPLPFRAVILSEGRLLLHLGSVCSPDWGSLVFSLAGTCGSS